MNIENLDERLTQHLNTAFSKPVPTDVIPELKKALEYIEDAIVYGNHYSLLEEIALPSGYYFTALFIVAMYKLDNFVAEIKTININTNTSSSLSIN